MGRREGGEGETRGAGMVCEGGGGGLCGDEGSVGGKWGSGWMGGRLVGGECHVEKMRKGRSGRIDRMARVRRDGEMCGKRRWCILEVELALHTSLFWWWKELIYFWIISYQSVSKLT